MFAVIMSLLLLATSMKGLKMADKAYENEEKLRLYEAYYVTTETLLDSVGVRGDNLIFNTITGQNYLDSKYEIDNYD